MYAPNATRAMRLGTPVVVVVIVPTEASEIAALTVEAVEAANDHAKTLAERCAWLAVAYQLARTAPVTVTADAQVWERHSTL